MTNKPILARLFDFFYSAFSFTQDDKRLAREMRYDDRVIGLEMLHV